MIDDRTVRKLRSEHAESARDLAWGAETKAWKATRSASKLDELRAHLGAFLDGRIGIAEFQTTFDKRTRVEWNIMGLKGLSCAMFLNTLVKHVPDQPAIERVLRSVLPVPSDPDAGREQMRRFIDFVDSLISSSVISKSQVQSSRIPFFVSAWWQIQEREQWPVYYTSMRTIYERYGLWSASGKSLIDAYWSFRSLTIELMADTGLGMWDVERLCLWLTEHVDGAAKARANATTSGSSDSPPSESEATGNDVISDAAHDAPMEHATVQMLLAKLGQKLGLKVWIAQNDHHRIVEAKSLGSFSMDSLPYLGLGDAAQNVVKLIDAIWIKQNNQIVAAFEIESTTSIYSGLLRMGDLVFLAPNTAFPIFIIAPEKRLSKVRTQLSRPTFQGLELHQRCSFFSIERFAENAPMMLMWMDDPAALSKIAEKVGDVVEFADPVLDES